MSNGLSPEAQARYCPSPLALRRRISTRGDQCPRLLEHSIKHPLRQLPGERVLLAGVIRADQHLLRGLADHEVPETRSGARHHSTPIGERRVGTFPSEAPEAHDHLEPLE